MTAKTTKPKHTEAEQVEGWMDKLDEEMKPAVNAVREIIKAAGPKLHERIKWNAPSFYYKEDMVTFGPVRKKDKIILVFHHPSIVKIGSALLEGDYKDRRLIHFNSLSEIGKNKKELERIITESVKMMDK